MVAKVLKLAPLIAFVPSSVTDPVVDWFANTQAALSDSTTDDEPEELARAMAAAQASAEGATPEAAAAAGRAAAKAAAERHTPNPTPDEAGKVAQVFGKVKTKTHGEDVLAGL